MYGPDCAKPLKPSNDAPRVEPATPKDPSDPMLREWVKTQPGPVKFEGTPCSFPGRVWKSKVGNYWNMLCALNGGAPWARFTSTDPALMTWKMADASFTKGIDKGAAAGSLFHKIPNAVPGGPTHMINEDTGSSFYLGTYDPQAEIMTVTTPLQHIESGSSYHWAASGNMGSDPDDDTGRLLTVAWVVGGENAKMHGTESYLSLIREMLY